MSRNRIARLLKTVYLKPFRMSDSPLKIAIGFGLGFFVGVMPGMGPVIALLLAFLFRLNRAGAFLEVFFLIPGFTSLRFYWLLRSARQ